jgi:hypothetical protein
MFRVFFGYRCPNDADVIDRDENQPTKPGGTRFVVSQTSGAGAPFPEVRGTFQSPRESIKLALKMAS